MEEPDVPPKAEDGEGKKFGQVFRSLFIPPHRFFSRQNDDAITKLGLGDSKVAQKKKNEGAGADGVEAKREEVAEFEGDEEGTAGNVDVEKISGASALVSASKGEGESNESKRNDTVGVHGIEQKRVGVSEAGGGEEGTGGEVDGEKISATPSKGDDEDSEKKELSGESYATPKDEEAEDNRTEFPYPRRPGLLNCAYYMRTGTCGYGENCKFNHPPRTNGIQVGQWNSSESVQKPALEDEKELPGKVGLIECKYFLLLGGCKFGSSCKFGHSQEISQATEIVGIKLNFVGLPIRPGQKECPYYMRTGECKFSSNCRFNHPNPTAVASQDFVLGWENGESPEQHASAEINMPNCIPSFLFPPKGLSCEPKFRSQVPQNPFPPSVDNIQPPSLATSVGNTKVVQQVADKVYPERPGQPECSYYMKTGDCKFKFACKFHHPRNRPTCNIGPLGLPSRPDQPICSFYSRFGLCKFGPACKYDHPVDFACSSPVTGGSRLV